MQIHLVAKDRLEAEGIRWIIETHLSGAVMTTFASLEEYMQQVDANTPDLLLLDMDAWLTENDYIGGTIATSNYPLDWNFFRTHISNCLPRTAVSCGRCAIPTIFPDESD